MVSKHFTVWQCKDECCEDKPFHDKWWNVGIAPGNYESVPTWERAMRKVVMGRLSWS